MKRAILVMVLMSALIGFVPKVLADSVACDDYPFPSGSFGWSVQEGQISINDVVSISGNPKITVTLTFSSDKAIYKVGFNSYKALLLTQGFYRILVETLDADDNTVERGNTFTNDVGWGYSEIDFSGLPARKIKFYGDEYLGGAIDQAAVYGLHAQKICTTIVPGPLPSNTPIPTSTPTGTLLPTSTPTITLTPSSTTAPSATLTPTITLTPTPGPSTTALPTNNISQLVSTRGVMPTSRGPGQCADVFNPCGALPYGVPRFPTWNLASPTLIGGSGGGGGTPTAVPPTGTIPPGSSTAVAATYQNFSTSVSGFSGSLNTLSALNGTMQLSLNGTPQSAEGIATQISGNSAAFIGTIKGIQLLGNSRLFSMLIFFFLAVMFVIVVRLFTLLIPLIIKFIQFVLDLVGAIKPI